ncbi:MAG: hypothetical protein LRS49_00830, partial [Desulfurococcales archaeon]|nr:hypothetical protein [Desulfurococcales archaeon]
MVLGPNTSGKTTLIEALAFTLIPNLTDIREGLYKLMVLAASRGSQRHALATLVGRGGRAKPCVRLRGLDSRARGGGRPEEKTVCVELEQRERLESRGMEVEGAVDIDI